MGIMLKREVEYLLKDMSVFELRNIAISLGRDKQDTLIRRTKKLNLFIVNYANNNESCSNNVKDVLSNTASNLSEVKFRDKLINTNTLSSSFINELKDELSSTVLATISNQYNEREKRLGIALKGTLDVMDKVAKNNGKELLKEAKEVLRKEAKKYRTIQVKIGNKKPKKLKGVLPKEFDTLLQLAQQRKNTMMVGPAGCGKTYIASKIAEALSMDFASQSCSAGMSESQLTGWLLPIGKSGQFSYVSSEFVRIYENGGVFLFDEIDASDSNVLIIINAALANDSFSISQRYKKPTIKKHKDFVAVAAANTYGNGADTVYVGRNQLDAATLDRFKIGTVTMNYDETVERSLSNSEVYDWAIGVRGQIEKHGLRRIMSTRIMIDATDMIDGQNWPIGKIASSYFSDWSKEEMAVVGGLHQYDNS